MEIKATLQSPYTEEQRLDFIVENNHRKGYEIRESEHEEEEIIVDPETGEETVITIIVKVLEAWGDDNAEKLEKARNEKYQENETIRDAFLVSGVTYKDILWDSDLEQKLNIFVQLSQMGEEDTVVWVAMDGITALECTKADLLAIGQLLTTMTAYVWEYKNPGIKQAIADAETIEELNEIEIVYDMNEINEEEQDEVSADTSDN